MFPASAGMNRVGRPTSKRMSYVPRERGDEPEILTFGWTTPKCSPRARG